MHLRWVVLAPLLVVLASACSKDKDKSKDEADDELVEKIDAKAKLGGKKTKVTSCKAKNLDGHSALLLELEGGTTLLIDPVDGLRWGDDDSPKKKMDCEQTKLEAGDGSVGPTGQVWWVGSMKLRCDLGGDALELDGTFDCGSKDRPSNLKKKK